MAKTSMKKARPTRNPPQAMYVLRLYVHDATPKSRLAVENIKRVCEVHLDGRYDL
jgi:circadian clock protein KaiB